MAKPTVNSAELRRNRLDSTATSRMDVKFWSTVLVGFLLVVSFKYSSMQVTTFVAVIFLIMVTQTVLSKSPRVLGYLLLASCYERPVLDFDIGIRGTIKLVDLVIVALLVATLWRTFKGSSVRGSSTSLLGLWMIAGIAATSSMIVTFFADYAFEETRKSVYYAVVLTEYCLALWAIQKISFSSEEIRKYLVLFAYGLVVVAIIGILQGLGFLENEYYTSATTVTKIETDWAISVLGPNHTHLGTYMALGVALAVMFLREKLQIRYILMILVFLGALAYSHSAVGFGMIGLYLWFAFFKRDLRMKTILVVLGVMGIVFIVLYMSGIAGDAAERTAGKYDITGEDSELFRRAIVYPIDLLTVSTQEFPAGIMFGFGYKVSNLIAPWLPPTGDNNYFSVMMDVGLIGFILFLLVLKDIFRRTKLAVAKAPSGFAKIFTFNMHVWLKVLLVAMFVQEILWPLHSRGSTMIIFLILLEVSASTLRRPVATKDRKKGYPSTKRGQHHQRIARL